LQFGTFPLGPLQPHHYIKTTGVGTIVDLAKPNPCLWRHPENNSRRKLTVSGNELLRVSFMDGQLRHSVRIAYSTNYPNLSGPIGGKV
jgi:hypothetical protein